MDVDDVNQPRKNIPFHYVLQNEKEVMNSFVSSFPGFTYYANNIKESFSKDICCRCKMSKRIFNIGINSNLSYWRMNNRTEKRYV